MDAVDLIRNRVAAVNRTLHALVDQLAGVDLAEPVLPGTSPPGLTLWHLPRTQDWLVNTTIRAVPEVADSFPPKGLPDHALFGFGTGLSQDLAREAASAVDLRALVAYADAVAAELDGWLGTLAPADLDAVPDLIGRQQTRPAYRTPETLSEVEGLVGIPVGQLLMRPAVSHLFMHAGELELLGQLARRSSVPSSV